MTREEAIQRLINLQDGSGQTYEAIRIAIESLSAKPSGDLISRQDAIEGMNKLYQDDYEQFGELDIPECFDNDRAIEVINALPSTNRPNEYNLELIADIVRQLGHLDDIIADTCDRPKGKWIEQYASKECTAKLAVCSECGWYDGYKAKNYNFCPNCGADMRGEKNE